MLASLVHYLNEGDAITPVLLEQQAQFRFFRRFRNLAILVLSGLLVLLLANFLLFSSVRENLVQLKTSGESQVETIREIDRLKAQIEEYSHLSLNRLDVRGRYYSFYLEELALHRPSGVWFNQLVVDPFRGRPENGKAIETDLTRISLIGESRDPVSMNQFISALKDLSWVSDIELKNYELSRESSGASFEICIRKDDEP